VNALTETESKRIGLLSEREQAFFEKRAQQLSADLDDCVFALYGIRDAERTAVLQEANVSVAAQGEATG
jgi:hypothetical protein